MANHSSKGRTKSLIPRTFSSRSSAQAAVCGLLPPCASLLPTTSLDPGSPTRCQAAADPYPLPDAGARGCLGVQGHCVQSLRNPRMCRPESALERRRRPAPISPGAFQFPPSRSWWLQVLGSVAGVTSAQSPHPKVLPPPELFSLLHFWRSERSFPPPPPHSPHCPESLKVGRVRDTSQY
jgi:hypothetical protein